LKNEIRKYYNELAENYDNSRFDNSYGQFIHNEEIRILDKYLDKHEVNFNLDIACGTGRFLDYASHGVDISEEMLKLASSKYPKLDLRVADAEELPFDDNTFNNITCFHLMMHLDQGQFENILDEANRVLKSNSYLIFDLPSAKRRKLTKYTAASWHGAYQATLDYVIKYSSTDWKLVNYHGVSFFPLHRVPKILRSKIAGIDSFLCNSVLKEYSSYLVFILQKR